jgi:hypothetical protein
MADEKIPKLGRPALKLNSVSRSYAVIAMLEKVGTEAWQNQLKLTVQDMHAIHAGETTPRLERWFKQRKAVETQVLAQLAGSTGGEINGVE